MSGTHLEGLESRSRFDAVVKEFTDKFRSNGFLLTFEDGTVDLEAEIAKLVHELPDIEAAVGPTVTSDTGFDGSEVILPPRPLTLARIKARIKEEKEATGGNKILSQKELADRIGVSRARIRQALR